MYTKQTHTFAPLYDSHSKILILGSFPSVKSREAGFYYGHGQNRFWRVLSTLFSSPLPTTIPEKKLFLLENNIAVWDVIASCEIIGSSDSSIRNAVPNDIASVINTSNVQKIFANGKLAEKLYVKYVQESTGLPIIGLPSTSPANAAFSIEKLCADWQILISL